MGMRRNIGKNQEEKVTLNREKLVRAVKIFSYIRPYRWYFAVGMLLLSASSLLFMVFPGAAGDMANVANGDPSRFGLTLRQFGWFFVVILVLQSLFSYLRTITFAYVSEKGMADVRKALYAKLITQPYTAFEQTRVGELTSRITTDVNQLQNAFSVTLAEFFRQIITLVAGVAIISWLTPRLAVIMLLTFPVVVFVAIIFGRYIRKLSRKRQDELAEANTVVEETMQSFSVVKSFANEWLESLRYGKAIDKVVDTSLKFARIRGLFFIFVISFLFGAIFFILWQGAKMVERGEIEVGDLFSFILYTGIIGGAIGGLGNLYTALAGAIGATERVLDLLEQPGEIDLKDTNQIKFPRYKGVVTYDNVQFHYPTRPDVAVLKGISFHIAAGQKVALVGASGAGKSTIIQLLLRFYPVNNGQILIDNQPSEQFDLTAYRKNLAIVPQEVLLFGGTIRENILYGNPGASEQEVIEAAKQANAWDFIQGFPEGLETVVGERGIKLSGGQRQRVAIARAILKDPAILLLDEATSSLDAESELLVQQALDQLMEGRTSIIIAHRLSTIRNVDQIYVLEDGKIVEAGTHDELYQRKDGIYHNLAKLQFDMV